MVDDVEIERTFNADFFFLFFLAAVATYDGVAVEKEAELAANMKPPPMNEFKAMKTVLLA